MIRKEKKRERKRAEERIGYASKERNRTDWNYAMKIKKMTMKCRQSGYGP